MQINGKRATLRSTTSLVLTRQGCENITLKVASVPVGINRDYEAIYPQPIPPTIVTNKAGGKVERERNYDDPKFIQQLSEYNYLRNIYIVVRVLECDSNVKFDNQPNSVDELRAILQEMIEAGISEGDIAHILEIALSISKISSDDINTAKESF